MKKSILFVCTGNSCRSQMAEGWARHVKGDCVEPYSAGIEAHGLDPRAVQVMGEIGVDISQQKSKLINELDKEEFDYVITMCNDAHERCPCFPGGGKRVHHGFANPPLLARDATSEEEAMAVYRRVRDEIRAFVDKMLETL